MRFNGLALFFVLMMLVSCVPVVSADGGENCEILRSQVYYVSVDGDDANDGLSWGHAKEHIQSVIDVVDGGAVINVGPGTYKENLQINKSIQLKGVDRDTVVIDGNIKIAA